MNNVIKGSLYQFSWKEAVYSKCVYFWRSKPKKDSLFYDKFELFINESFTALVIDKFILKMTDKSFYVFLKILYKNQVIYIMDELKLRLVSL